MEYTIEKRVEIKAPRPRVWQALTDHTQFGAWLRVNLQAPFQEGKVSTGETPTLVEFWFEENKTGTLLRLKESGFEKIPGHRLIDAMRMNEYGWSVQIKNSEQYVRQNS